MARIRTIKPEMASDVRLARVSRDARYTFVLMISQSDDHGLLAGAVRQLLGTLYPLDDDVTGSVLLGWIGELVTAGMLRWRETRDGVPVVEIINWKKHQRIDNASRSQLAALLVDLAETRREPPQDAEVRGLELGPRTIDLGASSSPAREEKSGSLLQLQDLLFAACDLGDFEAAMQFIRATSDPKQWADLILAMMQGLRGQPVPTGTEVAEACRHYLANGERPNFNRFRGYVRSNREPPPSRSNGSRPGVAARTYQNGLRALGAD